MVEVTDSSSVGRTIYSKVSLNIPKLDIKLFMILIVNFFLLLAGLVYLVLVYHKNKRRKNPELKSRWKYPPSDRILQFIFCSGNLLIFGLTIFPLGGLLLMVSYNSGHRLLIILWIILLTICSIISLFRPKFTPLIFLFYGLIYLNNYLDSPDRIKSTPYHDICNELRDDINCKEDDAGFNCSAASLHPNFSATKSICENNTSGNSDYDFEKYTSPYLGKIYTTTIPLLYQKNLPRNNCRNRSCGHKLEMTLDELRNSCIGCLDKKRLTTKQRFDYVPINTKLTVIDSYKLVSNGLSGGGAHETLILKDEMGRKSEISESSFKNYVIEGDRNWDKELEDRLLKNINLIKNEGSLKELHCSPMSFTESKLTKYRSMENSKYIEVKTQNFINDFKLNNELKITEVTWLNKRIQFDILYGDGTMEGQKRIPSGDKITSHSCAVIKYTSIEAYLTAYYYLEEWSLYTWKYDFDKINHTCALERTTKNGNFSKCNYFTELIVIDNGFEKLSPMQYQNYKRVDEDKLRNEEENRDFCNFMRNDHGCFETDTHFTCSTQSEFSKISNGKFPLPKGHCKTKFRE